MENPQHAIIEQYLDHALSPEARAAFEAELTANPELARALRLHEVSRAAVEMQALLDRRDRLYRRGQMKLRWRKIGWQILDAFERMFVRQRADGSKRTRWEILAPAGLATIALLLFLINPGLFFPEPTIPKPRAIPRENAMVAFNAHFKPVDISNTLGAGSDTDTLWRTACNQYAANNCAGAIPQLDYLLQQPDFDRKPKALLLKGTCQIESNEIDAAIRTLQQIPQTAATVYADAQWYIAMAYLKQANVEQAATILNAIAADESSAYASEAKAILGL